MVITGINEEIALSIKKKLVKIWIVMGITDRRFSFAGKISNILHQSTWVLWTRTTPKTSKFLL
jgi:hypothetical protein